MFKKSTDIYLRELYSIKRYNIRWISLWKRNPYRSPVGQKRMHVKQREKKSNERYLQESSGSQKQIRNHPWFLYRDEMENFDFAWTTGA